MENAIRRHGRCIAHCVHGLQEEFAREPQHFCKRISYISILSDTLADAKEAGEAAVPPKVTRLKPSLRRRLFPRVPQQDRIIEDEVRLLIL